MKTLVTGLVLGFLVAMISSATAVEVKSAASATVKVKGKKVPPALAHSMKTLEGKEIALAKYLGQVILVVNTASECGLTPQYEGLQDLHKKFGKAGLTVVGVPCNQFGQQEPGTAAQITSFCKKNYGVDFDMLAKVEVNGPGACGLYKHLTTTPVAYVSESGVKKKHTGKVGWNFEKFLLGRNGKVVKRFAPGVSPDSEEVLSAIKEELEKK